MRKVAVSLLVVAVACSSDDGATAKLVVPDSAFLVGVSIDEASVASYVGAERQPSGAFLGPLQVSPVAGGAAQRLDDHATSAAFGRGTTLYYLGGASLVTEGTPAPRPRGYGALRAWLPAQASPVALGSTVGAYTMAQDGSAVAFIDRSSPSVSAPGTVKVWSTSMCGATCADPITVAAGVTSATIEVATDGKHVLVGVPKIGDANPQIMLVTFPGGTVTPLSTATTAHAAMLSADGAELAWVEGGQILVAQTANPTEVSVIPVSIADPGAIAVQQTVMADATHFVARVKVGTGDPTLYEVTAAATAPLGIPAPVRFSVTQTTPSGSTASGRYLFYSTTQDDVTGAEDLWVADLQNPTAAPVALATQTTGNPAFSDDASVVRFLDNEDLDTTIGDLYVSSLPTGTPLMVAPAVRQAAFLAGSTTLLEQGDVDASGGGVLTRYQAGAMPTAGRVIPGVATFQLPRSGQANLYYTQDLGLASDGVYRTGTF